MRVVICAVLMIVIITGCESTSPYWDDGVWLKGKHLGLDVADTATTRNYTGAAPFTIYALPEVSVYTGSEPLSSKVEKVEIDFGDGSAKVDATAAAFDFYAWPATSIFPLAQRIEHVFAEPGEYDVTAQVTWTDGTSTDDTFSESRDPLTVTVLAPEAAE
jgi:hypothetical protein